MAFRRRSRIALCLLGVIIVRPVGASAPNGVFKIPPVKIPLDIQGQPVALTARATLTLSSQTGGLRIVARELNGDLSELQHNLTGLLSSPTGQG